MLPRISNFDDFDPLKMEPDVRLVMVAPGEPLPVCDLVILPGSKATIADLAFFRAQGWDVDLPPTRGEAAKFSAFAAATDARPKDRRSIRHGGGCRARSQGSDCWMSRTN